MKCIVLIFIVMVLFMNIPVNNIYGENGTFSKFDSLKLKHETAPNICLFEVDPLLHNNWASLKNITIIAINEWIIKLEYFYPDGDWGVDIKIISWEDHKTDSASDYPECNIMINYDKSSNGKALGNTSLNFNKSWHKYMFINIFLESQKSITKIIIGDDMSTATVNKIAQNYTLSENTIKNIVLHEFGHGLGLAHYDKGRLQSQMMSHTQSVMVPSINPFDKNQFLSVTYIDLVMIGKIYGENGWNKPTPIYHIKGCYVSDSYIFRCF